VKRLLYRYFSEDYRHILSLMAAHFREMRIRAGLCYAPGCQRHGIVWLDQSGIFCWDHYCAEMQARRADPVGPVGIAGEK
jgi:hypothetical protein